MANAYAISSIFSFIKKVGEQYYNNSTYIYKFKGKGNNL